MTTCPPATTHYPVRYPPFAGGLPATPVVPLRARYAAEIAGLTQALGLSAADTTRWLTPVLDRLTHLVLELPGGPVRYRHAGGLYHYGLTVALLAVRFSAGRLFDQDLPPAVRHQRQPWWRLAIAWAGLGQVLTPLVGELRVVDVAGTGCWDPYRAPLRAWLADRREPLIGYRPVWQEPLPVGDRPLLLARHLLPTAALAVLPDDLRAALLAGLTGSGHFQELLGPAHQAADRQDQARQAADPAAGRAAAVGELLRGLRELTGPLAAEPILDWPALAGRLLYRLRQCQPANLPLDADLLAHLLCGQGLAEPVAGGLRLTDPWAFGR